MAKPRRNAPALYELIGGRPRASQDRADPAPVVEEFHEDDHPGPGKSLLAPGRTVRMPVGYFFFGLAIVIATGIGGYMIGFRQGEARIDEEMRRQATLQTPTEPEDLPVNRDLLDPPSSARLSGRPDSASRPDSGTQTPSAGATTGTGRIVMVADGQADPRDEGVNYAIVSSLGRDRAEDLAAFLSRKGVDVAVARLNNTRLFSVVALRGFPSGEYRSEARRQFEADLKRLGVEYAALGGGRKDFAQLWWYKH